MDVSSEVVTSKLGLWGVLISAVIAIIFLVGGALILWALGLIVAVAFSVIGLLFLYGFHKLEILDVEKDRWLLSVPFIMFGLGLVADHVGVLSVQPLSVSNPVSTPITLMLLVIIVVLLVVDILVSRD